MLSTKKIDDFVRTTFKVAYGKILNLHLRLLDAKNTFTELDSRLNILKGEKVKNMRDKWWQDAVIYQGNDCFVARHETGDSGRVIGIDFTPAMVDKARANAAKPGLRQRGVPPWRHRAHAG